MKGHAATPGPHPQVPLLAALQALGVVPHDIRASKRPATAKSFTGVRSMLAGIIFSDK
jgi:hypothetical protein